MTTSGAGALNAIRQVLSVPRPFQTLFPAPFAKHTEMGGLLGHRCASFPKMRKQNTREYN